MSTFTYRRGAERPNLTLPWQEETTAGVWVDLDLSTGYTFLLTLTRIDDDTTALSKTTGITGADGSVAVAWAADELDIPAGGHRLNLRATSGGLDRDYSPGSPVTLIIKP